MMPEIKHIIFLLVFAIMVQSFGLNYQMQSSAYNLIENSEEIKPCEFNPIISNTAVPFLPLSASILYSQKPFFIANDDLKIITHQEVLLPPPKR